jgi:DNA polymerase-3 subunit epsilon
MIKNCIIRIWEFYRDGFREMTLGRTLHGALLDTELLADVFLAMTRGQNSLMIEPDAAPRPNIGADGQVRERKPLTVRRATADELAEHAKNLASIDKESKGACIWLPKPEAETA